MGTDIHGKFQARTTSGWEDIDSKYDWDRNYQLFAVLAGVRNGVGFAGIPTGEAVVPISDPRGIPEDLRYDEDSIDWESDHDCFWLGDHSFSWLSGEEMLQWFETAGVVKKIGVISRAQWEHRMASGETGPPSGGWCGSVWGDGTATITHDMALALTIGSPTALVDHDGLTWDKVTHVSVIWESSLRDELGYFFEEVRRLSDTYGDIRMVFGFDS